jgi:acyl-coenzyme A thioesterase PaaI-like protein
VSGRASDPTTSAAALAARLGDRLPSAGSVSPAALELVARARELVAAVALTDADDATLAAAADQLAEVTTALSAQRREAPLFLVRHPDGRVESLLQAGSGRLNPQAPPLEWLERPTEPPPGEPPVPATVRARCTFTAAHAGSPGRVHGGVLALALDEVLGNAATASGASGLTVALEVSFTGPVPIDHPVEVVARLSGQEGRKSHATGEVLVDGEVRATGKALFVAVRS